MDLTTATIKAESDDASASAPAGPATGVLPLLALIAGTAVATIYYNQPILGLIDRAFGGQTLAPTLIPTATLGGYALGIVLLVPLGDRYPRRRLIAVQLACLSLACILAAMAPNLATLGLACVAIGLFATAAQHAVPMAAELAPDSRRGRTVGFVMTGLLLGIVLARTVSGIVGDHLGWRAIFWMAAALAAVFTALAASFLPSTRPTEEHSYAQLLASLVALTRRHATLRHSAIIQGCLFGAFNAFWTSLVFLLQEPPFRLGASAAGLFGLLAAGGALLAPLVGRGADRLGSGPLVSLGAALVTLAYLIFASFAQRSLWAIGVGVVLIDVGLNTAMIANQARIYAIAPSARGRLNTVFMIGLFSGGPFGAALGTQAWFLAGWPAVCAVGLALASGALAMALVTGRARAAGAT